MARAAILALIFVALGAACPSGHATRSSSTAPASWSDESRDLYSLGESRFAAGEPREAVTLWRAALLGLPEGTEADALRHKLVLRMGHALLVAYEGGDVDALLLARQVLERYVAWHAVRRGDAPGAAAERSDAYALLVAAEETIERLEARAAAREDVDDDDDDEDVDDDEDDDAAVEAIERQRPDAYAVAGELAGGAATRAYAGTREPVEDQAARVIAGADEPAEDDAARAFADAGEPAAPLVLDGSTHRREIVVKRYGADFFALPGVQRFFAGGTVGRSMFDEDARRFNEGRPRVLVRAGATSVRRSVASGDRQQAKARARAAVAAARGRLARCYVEATARGLADDVRLIVDLEVAADGGLSVTALRLRGADTFDARGERCVRDVLAAAAPSAPPPLVDVVVEVPLALFVEFPGWAPRGDSSGPPSLDRGIDASPAKPN